MDDDCPGKGKCHGCIDWCDVCGDVGVGDGVCDHFECDAHRCQGCRNPVTKAEAEFNYDEGNDLWLTCFNCWSKACMEDARQRANRLGNPDEEMRELEFVARTIGEYT